MSTALFQIIVPRSFISVFKNTGVRIKFKAAVTPESALKANEVQREEEKIIFQVLILGTVFCGSNNAQI